MKSMNTVSGNKENIQDLALEHIQTEIIEMKRNQEERLK